METPFFYFFSYEVYSSKGDLKTKTWGTLQRHQKICDSADWREFEAFLRQHNSVAKNDRIHWVSVNLLNA